MLQTENHSSLPFTAPHDGWYDTFIGTEGLQINHPDLSAQRAFYTAGGQQIYKLILIKKHQKRETGYIHEECPPLG